MPEFDFFAPFWGFWNFPFWSKKTRFWTIFEPDFVEIEVEMDENRVFLGLEPDFRLRDHFFRSRRGLGEKNGVLGSISGTDFGAGARLRCTQGLDGRAPEKVWERKIGKNLVAEGPDSENWGPDRFRSDFGAISSQIWRETPLLKTKKGVSPTREIWNNFFSGGAF